jgi:hypothetical protein
LLGKRAENVEQRDKRGEPPAGKASRNTLLCMLHQQVLSKRLGNRSAQPPPPPNPKPYMLPSPHHFPPVCTALAAAEVKCVRHFTKYPTQTPGDSIWNSSESHLSNMLPNSPPPPHSKLQIKISAISKPLPTTCYNIITPQLRFRTVPECAHAAVPPYCPL